MPGKLLLKSIKTAATPINELLTETKIAYSASSGVLLKKIIFRNGTEKNQD